MNLSNVMTLDNIENTILAIIKDLNTLELLADKQMVIRMARREGVSERSTITAIKVLRELRIIEEERTPLGGNFKLCPPSAAGSLGSGLGKA